MQITLDYAYRPRNRASVAASASPAAYDAIVRLLGEGDARYAQFLEEAYRFVANFERIAVDGDVDGDAPVWLNDWIPALDSISIYTLLALRNPRIYLEIGSGQSTKYARRAIADHGLRTEIVSIDPAPRAAVAALCNLEIRSPLEDVNVALFNELQADDVLFVDSSHRAFQNSDVTVFMTEILPMLAPGVIYGLHDIFLPFDYPAEWVGRYYNEQYLLQSYLLGGAGGDRIVLPNCYVCNVAQATGIRTAHDRLFSGPVLSRAQSFGACFWLQRGARR